LFARIIFNFFSSRILRLADVKPWLWTASKITPVSLIVFSSTAIIELQALSNCLLASFLIFSPPEFYVWLTLNLGCGMKPVKFLQLVRRMLFSLVLYFDRFNSRIDFFYEYLRAFNRRLAWQASEVSFMMPIDPMSISDLPHLFLRHYPHIYSAFYIPDWDVDS
jgi:hypothetical protein